MEKVSALAVEALRLPSRDRNLYPVMCGPAGWYPEPPGLLDIPARIPAPFDPSVFARAAAKSTEHVDHPPPIVTSQWTYENWEEEWFPASPRNAAKKARAVGWDARIGFSRGYVEGRKANTYELRDHIGVWLDGFGRRAVLLWERNPDAEFTAKKLEAGIKPGEIPSGYQWTSQGGSIVLGKGLSFSYPNATEMEEWIALQGAVLPSWYVACQKRVHDAQVKAKRRSQTEAESGSV